MTRESALAQLQSLGVPLGESGDVAELKREIVLGTHRVLRRFDPRHQCFRKVRHATEDSARKAAKRMAKLGLAPYECVHCRKWHVGSPPRARGEIR